MRLRMRVRSNSSRVTALAKGIERVGRCRRHLVSAPGKRVVRRPREKQLTLTLTWCRKCRGEEEEQVGEESGNGGSGENGVLVDAALALLRFYREGISPLLPNTCRFIPSCSNYSIQAYQEFGFAKGSILTAWRILRCNPINPVKTTFTYDPPRWPPVPWGQ